jgi:hypothetical protein
MAIAIGVVGFFELQFIGEWLSGVFVSSTPTREPAEMARRGSQRIDIFYYIMAANTLEILVGVWIVVVNARSIARARQKLDRDESSALK